ncbi:cholecystokinin receptor type A-like isoform X1 [Clavelina lepadiformis]|uniref:cholecystokinin receptor type A-like isoform X1 n=1 Tax=Clavelina lepadiformis TaxID=159417 RepID=UPI00404137A1
MMTSPTYYTMTDTNSFWTPTIDDIVGSTRDFGASNAGKNPCNGPTEDPSNVTSVNEVLSSFVESTSSANQWTTNGLNLLTTAGVNTTEVTFGMSVSLFVAYVIVFLFSTIGNLAVMVTLISNKRLRTVTYCFLLSLSVSDFLVGFLCIPIYLTGRILKRFIFGSLLCKIFPYCMGLSVSVSTFTLLALSFERYRAICHPFASRSWQTKSHANKMIALIWVLSGLLMFPNFFIARIENVYLTRQDRCTVACRTTFPSDEFQQAWYVTQLIVLFVIPLVCMTVFYTLISLKSFKGFNFKDSKDKNSASAGGQCEEMVSLKSSSNEKSNQRQYSLQLPRRPRPTNTKRPTVRTASGASRASQNASQARVKKKLVITLIIVVVMFFICWTPLFIVNVWRAFDPIGARKSLDNGIEVIHLLSYISTCANPIIYCFMSDAFRIAFIKAFMCCLPKKCTEKIRKPPVRGSVYTTSAYATSEVTQNVSLASPTTSFGRRSLIVE